MNLLPAQQNAVNIVMQQEHNFNAVAVSDELNFAREAQFACQALANNSYLATMAMNNQQSLIDAVTNIAAIGITLNPAAKHAYLVPRDKKVCLDISYMGLLHIATDSGSILWGQCKIVYANDDYKNTGINTKPTHEYSAFGDRGEYVGAYCTVKTVDGDFLTHEMSKADIEAIAKRSPSFKKGTGPWKTDYFEMAKKTVVKQAYKYWPKSDRINTAIDYQNNSGEGIEMSHDTSKEINLSAEQMVKINDLTAQIGRTTEQLILFLPNLIGRDCQSFDELTKQEAEQVISFLQQKAGGQS